MTPPLDRLFVRDDSLLREVMSVIDRGALGIALVVDDQRRLRATVTDGDVRRAILSGLSLHQPISRLLERKLGSAFPEPIRAPSGASPSEQLRLLQQHAIRHLPIVNDQGALVDLVLLEDLLGEPIAAPRALIMVGGEGKRLGPLTRDLPKPMLPVGSQPLLERIVTQLKDAGVRQVHFATGYLADRIKSHFDDGKRFGVAIEYLDEREPLGTAGAIARFAQAKEPMLVVNGDIVTGLDVRALAAFHREHRAELTVAVRAYETEVPYGVVECEGPRVVRIQEKPTLRFFVNAGIYLLEPTVPSLIEPGTRIDMPELIHRLLSSGRSVASFPIVEYWIDIGQEADYQRARRDVDQGTQP